MTFRERLLDLEKQRTALAQAIATFESQRQQALAKLPASFGYGDLDAFIKALKDAAKPSPKEKKYYPRNVTRPARLRKTKPAETVPPQVNASESMVTEPVPVIAVAVNDPVPVSVETLAPAPIPVGSDLGDPANFGLLPDKTLLNPASSTFEDSDYVDKISQAIAFARQVLATSKVPPAVWREWRDFEKQAGDVLRGRHRQVLSDSE